MDANSYLAPLGLSHEEQISMETKFGHFLRKTQLDETLQLFNILIGQMSFVGPRPGAAKNEDDLAAEREKYSPSAFDVKPGLTGLAQISLKDRHNPALKAKYDSYYVLHMNLWLDTKIFIRTTFHVVNDDLIKKSEWPLLFSLKKQKNCGFLWYEKQLKYKRISEEVDHKLSDIMKGIFKNCYEIAKN